MRHKDRKRREAAARLLRNVRADVANGQWGQFNYFVEQTGQRCLLGNMRYHLGWEEYADPGTAVDEYWEATRAVAGAIALVYPMYVRSSRDQTIMEFNDSQRTKEKHVMDVLDAAVLDLTDVEEPVAA